MAYASQVVGSNGSNRIWCHPPDFNVAFELRKAQIAGSFARVERMANANRPCCRNHMPAEIAMTAPLPTNPKVINEMLTLCQATLKEISLAQQRDAFRRDLFAGATTEESDSEEFQFKMRRIRRATSSAAARGIGDSSLLADYLDPPTMVAAQEQFTTGEALVAKFLRIANPVVADFSVLARSSQAFADHHRLHVAALRELQKQLLKIAGRADQPVWDAGRGELSRNGKLLRRYAQQATRVRRVLQQFQDEGWPSVITLSGPEWELTTRLDDVIRSLNRDLLEMSFRDVSSGKGSRRALCIAWS